MFGAEYLPFVIASASILFLLVTKSFLQNIKMLPHGVLSLLFAVVLDKSLNKIIISQRPFVVEEVMPLFPHIPDNGFPSEHTLFVCIIASIVFTTDRKAGAILWFGAVLVGVCQVAAKVHHFVDVVGAALIAIISTIVGYYCVKMQSGSVE